MPPDLDKYRPYLDGFDLDEEQKAEFIHALWTIMEGFADRAFGLHPVWQVPAARDIKDPHAGPDQLESSNRILKKEFRKTAGQ